jgi:YihY family inner membrane protein
MSLDARKLARSLHEGGAFYLRNHGSVYSAAIAFNLFLSAVPVLFLVFATIALVIGKNELPFAQLTELLQNTFPYGARVLLPTLRKLFGAGAGATFGIVGTVLLLVASFSATEAVHTSLGVMLMRKRQRTIVRSLGFHVAFVVGMILLTAAAIVLPPAWEGLFYLTKGMSAPVDQAFHALLHFVSTAMLLGILFLGGLLSYRYLSPGKVRLENALTGSLVFVALAQAIRFGFTFYIRKFSKLNLLYGSLFSIICFILVSYLFASAYLYGASVIGALERMSGERALPGKGNIETDDAASGN